MRVLRNYPTKRWTNLVRWTTLVTIAIAMLSLSMIARTQDDSERKLADLKKEVDSWSQEARDIYRLDCQAMEQLWVVYCGESDWEPNEEPDKDSAREKAEQIRDGQISKIQPLLSRYEDLKRRAEELKNGTTESAARDLLSAMETEDRRLEKLKDTGAWKGTYHPLVQYAVEYGKDRHSDMESSSSYACDVKDESFDGADGRPDCVSASLGSSGNCTVFEFKPENQKAKDKGDAQLSRYVPAVTRYYERMIAEGRTPDDRYGGQKIIDLIKARCMSGSNVRFEPKVATYRMCEKKYECINP
jgi:hypothetical protein